MALYSQPGLVRKEFDILHVTMRFLYYISPEIFGFRVHAFVKDDVNLIDLIPISFFQTQRDLEFRPIDIHIDNRLQLTNLFQIPILILAQVCVLRDVFEVLNTCMVQLLPVGRTEVGPALDQYVFGVEKSGLAF